MDTTPLHLRILLRLKEWGTPCARLVIVTSHIMERLAIDIPTLFQTVVVCVGMHSPAIHYVEQPSTLDNESGGLGEDHLF
ncbi:unnamed protein product [Cuscuta campestris]|uniref:Uncharacterized protein n=1 Tax=Cuscuta campestris TaxID=132261 RepID=A0A484L5R0_9ASTE|nr:unnamed protein product [Cuscuta campestris]